MSKKINKKTPTKKKKQLKIKPVKKKQTWKGEEATFSSSVPLKSLSLEDQKTIEYSSNASLLAPLLNDPEEIAKESNPDFQGFKTSDFEAALKATGQLTDIEIEANKQKFPKFDMDKFADNINLNDVPVEDMVTWVTCLLTNNSSTSSFDTVLKKFFNFRLGQLSLNELIVLRYNIDKTINEKAMPPEDISPGDDSQDALIVG